MKPMSRRADLSAGCVIYVDETGSFVQKENDHSGVVAILAPDDEPTTLRLARFASEFDAGLGDSVRRKNGEIKGAWLPVEHVDRILEFLLNEGLAVCEFTLVFDEILDPTLREDFAAAIHEFGVKMGRTDELEPQVQQIREGSEVDFYIAKAVHGLFRHSIVRELSSRGFPKRIEIICDPRRETGPCSPGLDVVVDMAFAEELGPSLGVPRVSMLAHPKRRWRVRRPKSEESRRILWLVDWIAHTVVQWHRPDLPEDLRREKEDVCRRHQERGLIRKTGYSGINRKLGVSRCGRSPPR